MGIGMHIYVIRLYYIRTRIITVSLSTMAVIVVVVLTTVEQEIRDAPLVEYSN